MVVEKSLAPLTTLSCEGECHDIGSSEPLFVFAHLASVTWYESITSPHVWSPTMNERRPGCPTGNPQNTPVECKALIISKQQLLHKHSELQYFRVFTGCVERLALRATPHTRGTATLFTR